MLCQCGCGLEASKGRSFKRFHRANLLPQHCVCGCGDFAKAGNKYIRGHTSFNLTPAQEQKRCEAISKATKGKPCSEHRRNKLITYFENPKNREKKAIEQLKAHQEHPEWFDNLETATQMRKQGLISSGRKGKKCSEETKSKMRENGKNNWKNPEFARKVMRRKPMSNPEKDFQNNYVEKNSLPFFFNGNANGDNPIIIDRKIPDFVHNTENKLIEIWGNFFHKGQNPQDRIDFLEKGDISV